MAAGPCQPVGVTVLGSTGSIGVSTLRVIAAHQDRYFVRGLSANRNVDGMLAQCMETQPATVAMADAGAAAELSRRLRDCGLSHIEVSAGATAIESLAADPGAQYVMAAIVGAAGLLPTLAAARCGKRVLLANKEALVIAGPLMMDAVAKGGAELLPIDSEHNAIFQCLPGRERMSVGSDDDGVERLLLTASGGPFRETPLPNLRTVTPEQACKHPNWSMGRKISVDSATMMNKGLELIEACWLFGVAPEQVEIVIHPQSVIHSMVAYSDGSVLAQMGNPDMRTPIAHALAWPSRISCGVEALDFYRLSRLDFERPDAQRFPCLRLAREVAQAGGTSSAILNAANEVAVAAFLQRQLSFTDIPRVIEDALEQCESASVDCLEAVLTADFDSRRVASQRVRALASEVV